MQVAEPLRQEITPKNILMIGPTRGQDRDRPAPGASGQCTVREGRSDKFTEVGYVGREVDSIIKELADVAVKMAREQKWPRAWSGAGGGA